MMFDDVVVCCPAGGAVGHKEARTDPVRWAGGRRIQRRQQEETLHCHRSHRGSACHIPGEEECLPSPRMYHWIMFCVCVLSCSPMLPFLGLVLGWAHYWNGPKSQKVSVELHPQCHQRGESCSSHITQVGGGGGRCTWWLL